MNAERLHQSDMAGIQQAAQDFLESLDCLDWERFRGFIGEEATAFMPIRRAALRLNGKQEIENAFESLFDEVRKDRDGPPYFHLRPNDLQVQHFGSIALVTFHLLDAPVITSSTETPLMTEVPASNDGGRGASRLPRLSRRTIVFEFQDHRWRMIHLHASNDPS